MSTNRKRTFGAGWVSPSSLPKGPNGRALCRWCQAEVPPRRQTFCSQACVDDWTVRTNPSRARALVAERDRGVCARCGLDTHYLYGTILWLIGHADGAGPFSRRAGRDCTGQYQRFDDLGDPRAQAALERLHREFFGKAAGRWPRWHDHLWEADHIVPVVEGGGECGLEGLRTLCRPCHRVVTAELRRRLAFRRTNGAIERHNRAYPAHQMPLVEDRAS